MKRLTIVGAGWAGLAAAVSATQAGWHVRLFEASNIAGGRARRLPQSFDGHPLDNGQHILIGAYRDTLALMRTVGLNPNALLQRLPLDLRDSNDQGLNLPDWPAPFNLLAGISRAQGWSLSDKTKLTLAAWHWQWEKFECDPTWTVLQLCEASHLSPVVMTQLIDPLCLSALNTPLHKASASVFLRVLQDALLGGKGSSDLLIPRVDLGALLPDACLQWLSRQGADVQLGQRLSATDIENLQRETSADKAVLLACPPWESARLTANLAPQWASPCAELQNTAIATVYMHCKDKGFQGLSRPMMALQSHAKAPAQFVFDKGALSSQHCLIAAVVSACNAERDEITEQVHAQVCEQFGLREVDIIQTVVEKRATLACTPMLDRPPPYVTKGLWACGDYIRGPYPSTLEGAVRSGQQVVAQISQARHG